MYDGEEVMPLWHLWYMVVDGRLEYVALEWEWFPVIDTCHTLHVQSSILTWLLV
jgi:hypothetical protein